MADLFVTWFGRICDITTRSYMWHYYITHSQKNKLFSRSLDRLLGDMTDSCVCDVTWAHACDIINRWYIWHYLFTKRSHLQDCSIDFESFQVIRLLHVCEVTWAHVWYYDSFIYVTLLIHKNKSSSRSLDWFWKPSSDVTHSCVWGDVGAFGILWLVHICDITTLLIHKNKSFSRSLDRVPGDMGWLRLVGSLKL